MWVLKGLEKPFKPLFSLRWLDYFVPLTNVLFRERSEWTDPSHSDSCVMYIGAYRQTYVPVIYIFAWVISFNVRSFPHPLKLQIMWNSALLLSWKYMLKVVSAGKIQLLHIAVPFHPTSLWGLILIWYHNGHFLLTAVPSAGGTEWYWSPVIWGHAK